MGGLDPPIQNVGGLDWIGGSSPPMES